MMPMAVHMRRTLSTAQRLRLRRRWVAILVHDRMRAFAPLIALLGLLVALRLLTWLRVPLREARSGEDDTIGLHGRLPSLHASSLSVKDISGDASLTACFNITASNALIDRVLPLRAPLYCKSQWYLSSNSVSALARAAVVVAAPRGTPSSALLRTVRSVLRRTPPVLLVEVLVSASHGALHSVTKRELEQLPKTRVLYSAQDARERDPWLASSTLRDAGASATRAPALVFLSAGTEVGWHWLQPLLGELSEDDVKKRRASVVLPVTYMLRPRTLSLPPRPAAEALIVGHDWGLRPLQFFRPRSPQSPACIPSPLLPGPDFAVSAGFLRKIGGLGGEGQTEFALRVWLCGGSIATAPCTVVAKPPACRPVGILDSERRVAVARKWMGHYSFLVRLANSKKLVDPLVGEPDAERAKCAPFRQYLAVAFPELQPSADRLVSGTEGPHAWGRMLSGIGECIVLGEDRVFRAGRCEDASVTLLTEKGYLVAAPGLTAMCMTREEGRVVASVCTYERRERQTWGIEGEKKTNVFARGGGTAQCLTAGEGGGLRMSPCRLDKDRTQTWTWEYRAEFPQDKHIREKNAGAQRMGRVGNGATEEDVDGDPGLTLKNVSQGDVDADAQPQGFENRGESGEKDRIQR